MYFWLKFKLFICNFKFEILFILVLLKFKLAICNLKSYVVSILLDSFEFYLILYFYIFIRERDKSEAKLYIQSYF